ncbi:hypothetical protein M3J09_004078 [Ascochyta lentis]
MLPGGLLYGYREWVSLEAGKCGGGFKARQHKKSLPALPQVDSSRPEQSQTRSPEPGRHTSLSETRIQRSSSSRNSGER